MVFDSIMMSIHTVAAVLWVGGIFFAYRVLRPAAMMLEPPVRLQLWVNAFGRFFPWVWGFIFALIISGYWDWFARFGDLAHMPLYLHAMQWIGWLMIVLFAWLYFVPFAKFKTLVAEQQFPEAGKLMNQKMRPVIAINLSLGVLEAIIGVSGPYLGV
ncbi:CopD family protein [Thiosulfativibrio zosterae]|uniref:Copper resistance protein D domain-containing protein n=1 Tax=Thiosulfativibrio zosterae TaxID=2675053 RepID=A0A6F8PN81_9GAMM|nr:CopD family protein [Thiosulfativibrio zosterae]BBP43450.1 hypothetical protein THMIRHAT_11960 [Thiosulfativibrio zosterae]